MVEIADKASARLWLDTQPHQVRVWFAARCAFRAFPSIGFADSETLDHLALASYRAMLISGPAGICPAPEMSRLRAAADSARSAAQSVASAAYSTRSAAYSASSRDTENPSAWPQLWHNADMPDGLAEGWTRLRRFLESDPET